MNTGWAVFLYSGWNLILVDIKGGKMAGLTDGLVQGDEAKKIYVARSKSVDEKTVTAANKNALTTKVQGEEQDGW
jgi:hypothetical protein